MNKVWVVTVSNAQNVVSGVYWNKEDAKKDFEEEFMAHCQDKDDNGTSVDDAFECGYAYFADDTYIDVTLCEVQ